MTHTTTDRATFSAIILKVLSNNQKASFGEYKLQLREKAWLYVHNECVKPTKVLKISPKDLHHHLDTIVELSEGGYISQLDILEDERKTLSRLGLLTSFDVNDVLRFVLKTNSPDTNAEIICDALQVLKKTQSANHQWLEPNIFDLLKRTRWIPCQGEINAIAPGQVIHYPTIQHEIEEILSQSSDSDYVSSSQIDALVSKHEIFQWLTKEKALFIRDEKALKILGQLMKDLPEYWIGGLSADDFENAWSVLQNLPADISKGWAIAKKLGKSKFKDHVLKFVSRNPVDSVWGRSLLNYISDNNTNPDEQAIEVYNHHLNIACQFGEFATNILPKIKLLNQEKEWKVPSELCWEDYLEHIIIQSMTLHKEQRLILKSYLNSLKSLSNSKFSDESEILSAEIRKSNFEILREYFKPWESKTSPQFIGAFLCLLTKDEPDLEYLAQGYLRHIRNIELLRARLLKKSDKEEVELQEYRIILQQPKEGQRKVLSVIGHLFYADITQGHINHPGFNIVEDVNFSLHPTEIFLSAFNISDFQGSLENLLKRSVCRIVTNLYGISLDIHGELTSIWKDLLHSNQLDIQVARNFILESAPYVLRELGVHQASKQLNDRLQKWDTKRHYRAELEAQSKPTHILEQEIKEIIRELSVLLEGDSADSDVLRTASLNAVRKKIENFGYDATSIPFEIFQNADDAVVEMEKIYSDHTLNEERKNFVLEVDDDQITFMHWGRPINLCWISNNFGETYRQEGFDRDLEKMLVLNISDKSVGTTGKFGLGFKSIHLVTKNPQVVSGDLEFTVIGGLLPSVLGTNIILNDTKKKIITLASLREQLKRFSSLEDGTLIRLNIDSQVQIKSSQIIERFYALVPLLLVFSRRIRYCEIKESEKESLRLSWQPSKILGFEEIESGQIQLGESLTIDKRHDSQVLCLRPKNLSTMAEGAALLLGFTTHNGMLEASFSKNIPTFWITAPTRKELGLGFIINANFDPTTGREGLLEQSKRNREIAEEFGKELGCLLSDFFHKSEQNWQDFLTDLGVSSLSKYDFWNFIWQELAVKWLKLESSPLIDIIRLILGGQRGMGYFVTHNSALPTGLSENYQQLVDPKEIEYFTEGILSKKSYFIQVSQWPQFKKRSCGKIVSENVWKNLELLLHKETTYQLSAQPIGLVEVLKWEISDHSRNVNSNQALYLGQLITKEFLSNLNKSNELKSLQQFLSEISFQAEDSNHYLASTLLLNSSEAELEESLLAGFAPKSRLLHSCYVDTSLKFFKACRTRRDPIDVDTLAKWILETDKSKSQAVQKYLLKGNDRDILARELVARNGWFSEDEVIQELLKQAEVRHDIEMGNFKPDSGEMSPEAETTGHQPDGTGNTEWGKPGEYLAEIFYHDKLGYTVLKATTDVVDFQCVKDLETFQVEVKTISSKAVRLPIYEWNELMKGTMNYELLIIQHDGHGHVRTLFRVRKPKELLQTALERLDKLSLTNADKQSSPNVESLLGLQRDKNREGTLINVVILNWRRFIDEYATETSDLCGIEIHPCQATLLEGQSGAIDIQWQ